MIKLSGNINTVTLKVSHPKSNYKKNYEWESKLRLVVDFYNNFQHKPKHNSTDEHEAVLARWLNTQIVAINSDTIRDDRLVLLNENLPWLIAKRMRSFEDRIEDLRQFVADNNRVPKNTLDEEKVLAQWLHGERVRYKKKLLSPERRRLLESVPNALSKQTFSDTFEMCEKAIAWCEFYGHLPRINISNIRALNASEMEESKLGSWMRNHSRSGIRTSESAESVFRREVILELYREYPTPADFKAKAERAQIEIQMNSSPSGANLSYRPPIEYRWRCVDPTLKPLMELILLEFEMSDWWGRGSRYARFPLLL